VGSKLFRTYLIGQAVLIVAYLVAPSGEWLSSGWQLIVAGVALGVGLAGVRRSRPQAMLVWALVAVGIFLNGTGSLAETILSEVFGLTESPNGADFFFMSMYPPLIVALAMLVYRRTAGEDLEATLLRTAACALLTMFLGIFAWEFIIWQNSDQRLSLAKRVAVTAYPLADLVVIALMLRLIFGGAGKNVAFLLIVGSLCCFLGADIGWAVILRRGTVPSELGRHLLVMTSMSAQALMGAALVHPALANISPVEEGATRTRLGPIGWAALAVSALTAPTVLLMQALLDHFYLVTSL
jgi:hypothetical protein